MANRYWVGGSGTWNTSSTSNWASSSGGLSGASAPTSADDVFFDASSNSGTNPFTVTVSAAVCKSCTISGLDGAMTLAMGTSTLTVHGSWSNPASNFSTTGTTGALRFYGTGAETLTTNGITFNCGLTVETSTGTIQLAGNATFTNDANLNSGTLDVNSFTLSVRNFSSLFTNTRSIAFGSGTIALTESSPSVTIISMADLTGFTWTGTGGFTRNNTQTATISIGNSANGTTSTALNVSITGGSSALTLTAGSWFNNLIFTGSSSTVTDSTAAGINVAGNLTLSATGTYSGLTVTFRDTSTVTSAGRSLDDVIVNASGATITCADAFSAVDFTLTAGTFTTANYALTLSTFTTSGSTARTLNLGSSAVAINVTGGTGWNVSSTTNLTFNAGTSTITLAGTSMTGGSLTYYNLVIQGTATRTISGSNTFNTISNTTQPVTVNFTAGATNTFTNFNLTGTAGALVTVRSTNNEVATTFSKASGTVNAQHLAIRSVTATGGATWNATDSADLGNNTGWNITAAAARYWVGVTATWDTTAGTKWATTSGGAGGASVPTLANPVIFDASSGACAISTNYGAASITCTGYTNTLSGSSALSVNGNFTLSSGMTYTYSGVITITGTATLTTLGKTFQNTLTIESVGRTVTLGGNVTATASDNLNLEFGTLALSNFTYTVGALNSNSSQTRAISFGSSGSISFTGSVGTVLDMQVADNFTYTGTSALTCGAATARTFYFGSASGATQTNVLNVNLTSGATAPVFSGYYGTLDFTGTTFSAGSAIYRCKSLILSSSGTYTSLSVYAVGTGTITTNGKTISSFYVEHDSLSGGAGTTTLTGAVTTSGALNMTSGNLNLAGYTFSAGSFLTFAGTKTLTFNGGNLTITGSGNSFTNTNPTNFTLSVGTGGTPVISMTSASAKTFAGNGFSYTGVNLNQGGLGALTISGSNTFNSITNSVVPATISFTAGTTQTLTTLGTAGTSGNLVTLQSATAGVRFNLSAPSGTISVSYNLIRDSNATGGATWQAYLSNGNVDFANNSGWDFGASSSGMLLLLC